MAPGNRVDREVRLLHTSDWHVGVTTRGLSRAGDLNQALGEVVAVARDFRPDLILHSGDLFHQPRPQVDELELAWDGLRRLGEVAPVVVIAGNHDSPQWFEVFAGMLGSSGPIRFVGQPRSPSQGGILKFSSRDSETIKLACLPFVHANRMLTDWDTTLGTLLVAYADRVMRIQKAYAEALQKGYTASRDILLFSAHLFVDGASLSTSERSLHVSDTYATRASSIPTVSYAAFGHIHKPQALPGGAPGRYAGSLIPIDFGEENDKKEVVLVEAAPAQAAKVTPVALTQGRPLKTLEGNKAVLEALSSQVGSCILRLRVHLSEPDPTLSDWARRVFDKAELVEVAEVRPQSRAALQAASRPQSGAPLSLSDSFAEYITEIGLGEEGQGLVDLMQQLEHSEAIVQLPELAQLQQLVKRP